METTWSTARSILHRLLSLLAVAVFLAESSAWADNTLQANADVWIADNTPGTNFEGNVNPSTQLRNHSTVRRVGLYEFTLPGVGTHETITDVEFRLEEFFGGSTYVADFGLLSSTPDLSAITYNSAIAGGYLAAGNDGNDNPVIGVNTTLAGNTWTVAGGTGTLAFTDGGAGLTSLVAGAAGATPQTVTLALIPQDPTSGETSAAFYGAENGESNTFYPHPRLTVRKELAAPTNTLLAAGNVWIASNDPDMNFDDQVSTIIGQFDPAAQLRNHSTVTRTSMFQFTLPQLAVGESIEGVQFQAAQFFDNSHFSADFALLASNPDFSTVTWNSAIADGYITGIDGDSNPILGANATAAGELWESFADEGDLIHFTDGNASDGLAQLIAGAASTSGPVDITLMMITKGQEDLGVSAFYEGSADFDLDTDADGHDFLTWQRGFGTTGTPLTLHSQGDANSDGIVNELDLLVWQAQIGGGNILPPQRTQLDLTIVSALSGVSAAVPEPSTLLLLLLGGLAAGGRRRRV